MTLELLPGFYAHADRFLWHAPTSTAILADLHLGFETAIAESAGIRPDFSALTRQWQSIIALHPRRVILAGDIFHNANLAHESIDLLSAWFAQLPATVQIDLLPGNHDPAMKTLRDLFSARVSVAKTIVDPAFTVTHGHDMKESCTNSGKPLIVGHLHPAVTLADRLQSAKMICFAWTPSLIILPTFSPLPLGTTLLSARKWILDLPMPPTSQIQIAGIIRDQVLNFGPLGDL